MKKLLVIFFLIFFCSLPLLALAANSSSTFEVKYPNVPGLPSLDSSNNPGLSEYIGYFFGLGVYAAGILSLISFAIGAIGLISPDPEMHSGATDRMKGAVLGLILTVTSFIIIRTINPVFITPALAPLQGTGGVFLTNGTVQKAVGQQVGDVASDPTIQSGYKSLIYVCSGNTAGATSKLLIWEYPKSGFQGSDNKYSGINVVTKSCGDTENIGGLGSFSIDYQRPGVYYYLGPGCTGYSSNAITFSDNNIMSPFSGNIQSVRIINDPTNNLYYGVIFHNTVGLTNGGNCSYPITLPSGQTDSCVSVSGVKTIAADIFSINNDPSSSGNGLELYSEPYGWDVDSYAGFYPIPSGEITDTPLFFQNSQTMCFDYSDVIVPDEYRYKCQNSQCGQPDPNAGCSDNACETFQDCPGSIRINGTYLVAIYSSSGNNGGYCQTFTQDVYNLYAEPVVASGIGVLSIDKIYVIPTK